MTHLHHYSISHSFGSRAVRRPRRAADNLWAPPPPPPTFVHRRPPPPIICRRAADGIFAVYLFSCIFRSVTKKGHHKILRIEGNLWIFRESLKTKCLRGTPRRRRCVSIQLLSVYFLNIRVSQLFGQAVRCRRRPKLTDASPPTQQWLRTALVGSGGYTCSSGQKDNEIGLSRLSTRIIRVYYVFVRIALKSMRPINTWASISFRTYIVTLQQLLENREKLATYLRGFQSQNNV